MTFLISRLRPWLELAHLTPNTPTNRYTELWFEKNYLQNQPPFLGAYGAIMRQLFVYVIQFTTSKNTLPVATYSICTLSHSQLTSNFRIWTHSMILRKQVRLTIDVISTALRCPTQNAFSKKKYPRLLSLISNLWAIIKWVGRLVCFG